MRPRRLETNPIGASVLRTPLSPVFIGGCPRSGTTMLGAMLGAHPRYVTPMETLFKGRLVRRFSPAHKWQSVNPVLREAGSSKNLQRWLPAIQRRVAEKPSPTTAVLVEDVVRIWADERDRSQCTHWIDHTPANITMTRALLHHWPSAKFVHLVRDGRAVAASAARLS